MGKARYRMRAMRKVTDAKIPRRQFHFFLPTWFVTRLLPRRTTKLSSRGNLCDFTPWQTAYGCRGRLQRLVRRNPHTETRNTLLTRKNSLQELCVYCQRYTPRLHAETLIHMRAAQTATLPTATFRTRLLHRAALKRLPPSPNNQAQQPRQPHKAYCPGKPPTAAAVGCSASFGRAPTLVQVTLDNR